MCVAVLVESKDPTPEEIRAMARQNPDGGGISWVDGDLVHYRRGLTADKAIALVARLPRPYFMHFRIATRGKPIPALTHPFPVGFAAITSADELSGMAHAVVMQNGTWQDYKKYVPHGIDADEVSDTQIAAYIVGVVGEDILDHVPWSNAIMRAAGEGRANITLRGSWTEHGGNQYSNLHWQKTYTYGDGYYSGYTGGYAGGGWSGYQWSKNGAGVYDRGFKTPPRGVQKYSSSGILTPDSTAGERAVHERPLLRVLETEAALAVAADIERDVAKQSKIDRRAAKRARRADRLHARRRGGDTQPMLALPMSSDATPITDEEWDNWLAKCQDRIEKSDGIPEVIPESERGVAEITIGEAIEAMRAVELDAADTIRIPRALAANTNVTRVTADEDPEDPPHESEIDLVDLMDGTATSRPSDRYLDRDWEAIDKAIRSQGIKV